MSLLRAKELIFTGDRITPQQAVEFGLANRVVAPDKLMDEARALADKPLKQPRQALREAKKIMNLYLHQNAARMLDTTLGRQLAATLSEEHHTIARDFIEKQKRNQSGK
jgi:enoyl-CoA hydratase